MSYCHHYRQWVCPLNSSLGSTEAGGSHGEDASPPRLLRCGEPIMRTDSSPEAQASFTEELETATLEPPRPSRA